MSATGVDISSIDTFIDALWLEEGLSKNTLQAYSRDLTLFAQWLQATPLVAVQQAQSQPDAPAPPQQPSVQLPSTDPRPPGIRF